MKLLSEVPVGSTGVLEHVDLSEEVSDHLAHLGFLPGAEVRVLRRAPAGDPTVYRIDGVEVGLRRETARHIQVDLNGDRDRAGEAALEATPPETAAD